LHRRVGIHFGDGSKKAVNRNSLRNDEPPDEPVARLRALNDENKTDAILQRFTEIEEGEALRAYLATP